MSGDDEPGGETQSTQTRWWLTNDVAALILVVTGCALAIIAALNVVWADVPGIILQAYAVGFGAAIAWLFGKGLGKKLLG